MPRKRAPYSLFKRGSFWSFWYWDGERRRALSTKETAKTSAAAFADRWVKDHATQEGKDLAWVPPSPGPGLVLSWAPPPPSPEGYRLEWVPIVNVPTLADFTQGWFTGSGPYETRRRIEGYPLARGSLCNWELNLRLYLLPHVGHLRLNELTTSTIEALKQTLSHEGKSGRKINQILTVLHLVIKESLHAGILEKNPFLGVRMVKEPGKKKRNLLTPPEVRRLLDPATVSEVWGPSPTAYAAWLATLLAAFTGARRNEVLDLEWNRVSLDTSQPYLVIDRQIARNRTETTPTCLPDRHSKPGTEGKPLGYSLPRGTPTNHNACKTP